MEAPLQALPTVVVEPPVVRLVCETSAILAAVAGFGHVIAPLSITAADLSLQGVPKSLRSGKALTFALTLGARHAAQCEEQISVSLSRLIVGTVADVFCFGVAEPQAFATSISHDSALHSLIVSSIVPATFTGGITIQSITIAGQPVRGRFLSASPLIEAYALLCCSREIHILQPLLHASPLRVCSSYHTDSWCTMRMARCCHASLMSLSHLQAKAGGLPMPMVTRRVCCLRNVWNTIAGSSP